MPTYRSHTPAGSQNIGDYGKGHRFQSGIDERRLLHA
jgi:hypothetical protein